jgi:hypothetical protein
MPTSPPGPPDEPCRSGDGRRPERPASEPPCRGSRARAPPYRRRTSAIRGGRRPRAEPMGPINETLAASSPPAKEAPGGVETMAPTADGEIRRGAPRAREGGSFGACAALSDRLSTNQRPSWSFWYLPRRHGYGRPRGPRRDPRPGQPRPSAVPGRGDEVAHSARRGPRPPAPFRTLLTRRARPGTYATPP